jgi:hypothetical protein
MEEIVYSNVQAKVCSGQCTYSCGLNGFELDPNGNGCSAGCNCDTTSDSWISGCNNGECATGYETGCTTGCI